MGDRGLPAVVRVARLLRRRAILQGPNKASDIVCVLGTFLCPILSFVLLAWHDVCPVPECGQFDFFSVNLVLAVAVALACQYCGFVFAETREHMSRLLSGMPTHALAVTALLLSMYWPYFTYWGPSFFRRNVWMGTYQATTPGPCPTVQQVLATPLASLGGVGCARERVCRPVQCRWPMQRRTATAA